MKLRLNMRYNRLELINEVSDEIDYIYDIKSKEITTRHYKLYVDELKTFIEGIDTIESINEKKKRIDEELKELFDEVIEWMYIS